MKHKLGSQFIFLRYAISIVFLIVLFSIGCSPSYDETSDQLTDPTLQNEISFEVLAQDDDANNKSFAERTPEVILVGNSSDISLIEKLVTEEAIGQLKKVNYSQQSALLVTQGFEESTNHGVRVESIVSHENYMNIYAKFLSPSEDQISSLMVTYPYQVVTIEKSLIHEENEKYEIRLFVDDELIYSSNLGYVKNMLPVSTKSSEINLRNRPTVTPPSVTP